MKLYENSLYGYCATCCRTDIAAEFIDPETLQISFVCPHCTGLDDTPEEEMFLCHSCRTEHLEAQLERGICANCRTQWKHGYY